MDKLIRKLEHLSKLEQITNQADIEMMKKSNSPENMEKFYDAFNKESEAYLDIAKLIVKMTKGKIDFGTASSMLRTKRNEVLDIVSVNL